MAFDAAQWLHSIGLDQCAGAFKDNGITDKDVLAALSDADLKDMGVTVLGHRKKILLEAEKLKGGAGATPAAAGAAASAAKPAAAAVTWAPASNPRKTAWAYSGLEAPFMKGHNSATSWLHRQYWSPLDLTGAALPCVTFSQNASGNEPAQIIVYAPESGGMSKRIPLNYEKWLGNATAVSQGFDLLNDNVLVSWGAMSNNLDGSQVSVWDPIKGAMKGGWTKPTDSDPYVRGCVLDESHVFVSQGMSRCVIYDYAQGFVERNFGGSDDNEFSWVMPRNRTPTGPGTVMSGTTNGTIDVWDCRDKCTTPSRTINTGVRRVEQIGWHPSNPDVLVVAPGYNNNERTIKAVSLSKGTELATFRYKGNNCCAVGIYGNVVAAGTGDVELFTLTDGENPVAKLEHATVGCYDATNMTLYRDFGIFGVPEAGRLCCFKY